MSMISGGSHFFQESDAFLYPDVNKEKQWIRCHGGPILAPGEIFLKAKNSQGNDKVWAVNKTDFLNWARVNNVTFMADDQIYSLVEAVKKELKGEAGFIPPTTDEEKCAILGFDPDHPGRNAPKVLTAFYLDDDIYEIKLDKLLSKFNPETAKGRWARREIGKILAKKESSTTSKFIKHYGFDPKTKEGHDALLEIAKIAAESGVSGPSEYIRNYGFDPKTKEGHEALLEVAKIAAANNGSGTSEYIRNYGFDPKTKEGHDAHLEIAKIAAAKRGKGTSEYICNYGFDPKTKEGHDAHLEIAKIAAANNGEGTSKFIYNYGFDPKTKEGRDALLEIATFIASIDPRSISRHIGRYSFSSKTKEGHDALLKIARISAENDAWFTSRHISNYGFDPTTERGQKALSELLIIASKGDLYRDVELVSNYCIKNPQILREVLKQIFLMKLKSKERMNVLSWFSELARCFSDSQPIFSAIRSLLHIKDVGLEEGQRKINELNTTLMRAFAIKEEQLSWTKILLSKTKDNYQRARFLQWLGLVMGLIVAEGNNKLLDGKAFWLLEEIGKRDPSLRIEMTEELFKAEIEGDIPSLVLELGDETKERPLRLPRLLLKNFPKKEDVIYILNTSKSRTLLKDGSTQKLFLETLLAIKNSSLDAAEKGRIVLWLAKQLNEREKDPLNLVKDIILFQGEEKLKGVDTVDSLRSVLEALFNEAFSLKVEGFSDKYAKTVGAWRKKEAIFTYAAKLNTLKDQGSTKALFSRFLTEVLENTFEKIRSSSDQNPHLRAIEKNTPGILEKWNSPIFLQASEMNMGEKEDKPLSERIFEQMKMAINHHHLDPNPAENFPHIDKCLKNTKEASKILEEVNELLQKNPKDVIKKQRLIEKAFLEVFCSIENEEALKTALETLNSRILNNDVFKGDIAACLKFLEKSVNRTALHVIDSSDPNHFLLMGTEVEGSCQKVGGDPNITKGLLGYMLDGKHRLLLVTDEANQIVARSVVRLLIDEKEKPVLFLEWLYTADNNPKYAPLIQKLVVKKAAALGIPLVASSDIPDKKRYTSYPFAVEALYGPIPFEYIDALQGIKSTPYKIFNTLLIV